MKLIVVVLLSYMYSVSMLVNLFSFMCSIVCTCISTPTYKKWIISSSGPITPLLLYLKRHVSPRVLRIHGLKVVKAVPACVTDLLMKCVFALRWNHHVTVKEFTATKYGCQYSSLHNTIINCMIHYHFISSTETSESVLPTRSSGTHVHVLYIINTCCSCVSRSSLVHVYLKL